MISPSTSSRLPLALLLLAACDLDDDRGAWIHSALTAEHRQVERQRGTS